ncbi:MAG TPA: DUF2306 domain-containing protein [Magnetospirillaceae bacterium]|nr:DUF2306 domain-containing protein [Magnetospirillaceae bacterium]
METGFTRPRALDAAARFWFAAALSGQVMFAVYIAVFYGRAAVRGTLADWNRVLVHGYSPETPIGNGVVAAHLLAAFVIALGGALQLVPAIRRKAPAFHRWNGRAFMVSALTASLAGLYMVWIRGSAGDLSQHLGISLNALLILVFAGLAWRTALARDFAAHRRWALRLFVVTFGVWFYRVGLMFWLLVNRGPVGFDPETFVGPFLTFLSFAQALLPLSILELYLRARERAPVAMAGGLVAATAAMGVGIVAASLIMWLPYITAGAGKLF